MVAWRAIALVAELATPEKQPLWTRLSPVARLKALVGLVLIVTLGLLLLLFIRSFGRFMRSYSQRPAKKSSAHEPLDDWALHPLEGEDNKGEP